MLSRGRHHRRGAVHRNLYAVLFGPVGFVRVFWFGKGHVRTVSIRTWPYRPSLPVHARGRR